MKQESVIEQNPILRRLCQTRSIPLLFSVTVVSGIFYHYAPKLTVIWILLSLVLQGLLFRLFDYVKKHNFIGGIAYLGVGFLFMVASLVFIRLGYGTAGFGPTELNYQLSFFVWFLTPQSVLSASYFGYTLAMFCFFTFFIASVAYYFTFVRYRVLMSFAVMIFPFAIYAKENETMPVPSIIILLVCYFSVMIYCRQAHAEDTDIVQKYEPDTQSRLKMPPKRSAFAGKTPELLDEKFLQASGIFIAAATILILVIPKPEIEADRNYMDNMLDMTSISDYLMKAISGFTDTSESSTFNDLNYSRTLYYAKAREPLNLRMRSFTDYDYDKDYWLASDIDKKPSRSSKAYVESGHLNTMVTDPDPGELFLLIRDAARNNPEFKEKWQLDVMDNADLNVESFHRSLTIQAAAANRGVYPSLYYLKDAESDAKRVYDPNTMDLALFQNRTGILFRYNDTSIYYEGCTMEYFSDSFANAEPVIALMQHCSADTWEEMLHDLMEIYPDGENCQTAQAAYDSYMDAREYAGSVNSQTPQEVRDLAMQLTEGLESDYDKAMAIRDYLRYDGGFVYSLDFRIKDSDNVSTFLFQNKTGVCVQFASAMAELCRAAGLPARYVDGYSMSEPDKRLVKNGDWDYAITTDHGHAFTDVYISGYGWLMMDATTSADVAESHAKINIIATLQYSGIILFGVALLLIVLLLLVVPFLREARFRSWFRKHLNAAGVQAAFARLRKQWKADPAATARDLCVEMSAFLQVDLSVLQHDFERTVYAERCDAETADRVYRMYCAAYDAWKPAVRRQRKAARAERAAARKARRAGN